MRLNQVTLPARDIEASVAFYTGMGFELIVHDAHYARFKASDGDGTFSVHCEPQLTPPGDIVIYFETGALDRTVEELQTKGYVFSQLPRDEPWLWREARLVDPAGNRLCLYHAGENRLNPPWRVQRQQP